jgi:hypothetical protein
MAKPKPIDHDQERANWLWELFERLEALNCSSTGIPTLDAEIITMYGPWR